MTTPGTDSPDFRRFWTGQTLAQFGWRLAAVAMPVVAVQYLNASPMGLGYLNTASTVAFLVLGLPAGAWIDRWAKRRTMTSPTSRASSRPCASRTGGPCTRWRSGRSWRWRWSSASRPSFFDVAYQSFIPVLVPDSQVGLANARLESTAQLATSAGPALGGLMTKVLSAPMVMLADALGYASSLWFLARMSDADAADRRAPTARRPMLVDIREGLAFVWRHPAVSRITACSAVSNLFGTMGSTLLPILVLRRLGLDTLTLGIELTCGSIGGALGAWLTRSFDAISPLPVSSWGPPRCRPSARWAIPSQR